MRLRLLSWMRSQDDASVGRIADATAWHQMYAVQRGEYEGSSPGCLVCHASGNNYGDSCFDERTGQAEVRYMRYAQRHGERRAGLVMQRLARGILARRSLEAMKRTEGSEQKLSRVEAVIQ